MYKTPRHKRNERLIMDTWENEEQAEKEAKLGIVICVITIVCALFILIMISGCAQASEVISQPNVAGYSLNQWCEAIHKAEGNDNYGILTKYKHTTPLQACRNTILHYWRDYSSLPSKTRQSKRFLEYAENRYAPIGVSNDPNNLNKHWAHNVQYYLERG